MQLLDSEAKKLASDIVNIQKNDNTEIVLCPSPISIASVSEALANSSIKLGAQNLWPEEKGAFTGETSPNQLKDLNTEYVILGHSERRKNNKESDEEVHNKTKFALDRDLIPVVCVGETFEERQAGNTDLIIINQVTKALQDIKLDESKKIIIAYEPVWVIGSGQAVKSDEAKHIAHAIRNALLDLYPENIANNNIIITYGGSVDAENILDFIEPGLIDGVLIGGASLSIEKFQPIIQTISKKQETISK